jgi:hypothetical protein
VVGEGGLVSRLLLCGICFMIRLNMGLCISVLRFALISSSHLRLGLPSGLFPSDFPTKILYAFPLSPCVLHALPISSCLI